MENIKKKVEIRPIIDITVNDGETAEQAVDRVLSLLDREGIWYCNGYSEEYTIDENGNEIGGEE